MGKIALLFAMLFLLPACSSASNNSNVGEDVKITQQVKVPAQIKQQLLGSPVFIQVFKEERVLELYARMGNEYRLIDTYGICNFSGGLGPKRQVGDFKSPEGFYSVTNSSLKPDSHYYRAINLGFPNAYDKSQGYSGAMLMIHGDCRSVGCYAMTDGYIAEIYRYVESALQNGQSQVNINIYPFRMTEKNMQRHRNSSNITFWRQLQPGFTYFAKHRQPPAVGVVDGKYVVNAPMLFHSDAVVSEFALTQPK